MKRGTLHETATAEGITRLVYLEMCIGYLE